MLRQAVTNDLLFKVQVSRAYRGYEASHDIFIVLTVLPVIPHVS